MFQLMIVEDEKITRDGLGRHINWNDLGVEVCLSVSNGMEALLGVNSVRPDILLSDIKMPHMNGIQLAEHILKKFPKCKIIFLSGYADKEYLLSAIHLKAVNYIEKPVNLAEIQKAVLTAVEQLKSEMAEELIHNSFHQTRTLANSKMITALISPFTDWVKFESDFIPLFFHWNKIGNYSVICLQFSDLTSSQDQIKILVGDVSDYLYRRQILIPDDSLIGSISFNQIVILVRNLDIPTFKSGFLDLQQELDQKFAIPSAAGISTACMSVTDICHLYKKTYTALICEIFYGQKNCILELTKDDSIRKPIAKEVFAMSELSLSDMKSLFVMLRKEKYSDIDTIRSELFKLYVLATEKTWKDTLISWGDFEQLTLTEYEELLCYEIKTLQLLGNGTYDIKIKKTIHFILSHFSQAELSVKSIADSVGLSQNYLSSLFKNQTGSTVNDFIIQVRLNQACQLLSGTDLKLYEITERIGFQDPNYLSSLFKKQYSITPSQYKKGIKTHEGTE